MSYWKTIKEQTEETPEARRLREKKAMEREQELQKAEEARKYAVVSNLKNLTSSFVGLQDKAHEEKDRGKYICSTGAICFLDNLDSITGNLQINELEDILDFFNELKENENYENLSRLKQLCGKFNHIISQREYRVHQDIECSNNTIGVLFSPSSL